MLFGTIEDHEKLYNKNYILNSWLQYVILSRHLG
jgi:hypothetical protein